jgi:hypothetical protein
MDETLQIAVIFQTYSLVLNLLNKTLMLLSERGASQHALNFMVQSINDLIYDINQYASKLAAEKKLNQELNEICARFKISRAPADGKEETGKV